MNKFRLGWLDAQEEILINFEVWLKILDKTATNAERKSLEKRLKFALSPEGSETQYLDFISGDNRNFRNWIQSTEDLMNRPSK